MGRYVKRLILFLILMLYLLLPAHALAEYQVDSVTATMIGHDSNCQYYIYEINIIIQLIHNADFVWSTSGGLLADDKTVTPYCSFLPFGFSCKTEEVIALVGVQPNKILNVKVIPFGYGTTLGWATLEYNLAQAPSELPQNCECELSINVFPNEVSPQKAGSANTTSTIMVSTTKPAPPEGCTVNLKVEPVENSGGHSHGGNRQKGTVTPITLTIPGGSSGAASAEYKASEVAGEEKIIAEIKGEKKGEAAISVKVPGLFDLGVGGSYRLTGSTGTHPVNHYGTDSAIVDTNYMANDFYEQFNATLGINDMSLPWGGLFDIDNNWSPPHGLHRAGKSVDIDRANVDQPLLNRIASRYGGRRVKEGARCRDCIHYEFP